MNNNTRSANTQDKKRDEILKSELRHVLDRGRETHPTAPVRRDSAEAIREREEVLETMAAGELDRRREITSVCPRRSTHRV